MDDDLWAEAGLDHDRMAHEAARALADAELENVLPFLLAARSPQEYEHRAALAGESISSIAARTGIGEAELFDTARRRFDLYRQALAEGQDPVSEMVNSTHYSGSGPEEGYEHDTGPDYSHSYSEVPAGPGEGPDPAVTRPRPPQMAPVQESTGMRRQAGASPQSAMTTPYMGATPPDTGTTPSVQTGVPSPAMGGMSPSLPAGVNANGDDTVPLPNPSVGQVTSSRDPVRRRVLAVKAAVAATNPQLPDSECDRIARQVVGRYLRHADLTDSVMGDAPMNSGGGSQGGGGDSGGGVGKSVEHGMAFQYGKGLMGGGGEAAGGAAELAELAPLAAL